jgi:hypothetical protein
VKFGNDRGIADAAMMKTLMKIKPYEKTTLNISHNFANSGFERLSCKHYLTRWCELQLQPRKAHVGDARRLSGRTLITLINNN